METNQLRLEEMIIALASFNDSPECGISRFSFGENDRKARTYLLEIIDQLGLPVRIDPIGNIFARFPGTQPDLPVIMTGSHIDSVKNGGKFDCVVGVVSALEAIRVMVEHRVETKRSVELVIFSEERDRTSRSQYWEVRSLWESWE